MQQQKTRLSDHLQSRFPQQPYPSQLELACDIYRALANNTKVAIFESPTGTGKSMALIVGAVSYLVDSNQGLASQFKSAKQPLPEDKDMPDWFNSYATSSPAKVCLQYEKQQQPPPKISVTLNKSKEDDDQDAYQFDYSSSEEEAKKARRFKRVVSRQWVQEVRRSDIGKTLTLTTLASRAQLCANEKIAKQARSSTTRLNHLCKQLKKCPKRTTFQANQPGYDIEELKALGQHTCPYYFSKSLAPNCDVVCTPYQLLIEDLDKLEDAIVVVDEAHNFGPALLQAKSASLSLAHIIRTAHGLSNYKAKYQHRIKAKTLYYVSTLLKLAQKLELTLQKMQIEATNSSAPKELDIVDLLVALECQNLELPKLIK